EEASKFNDGVSPGDSVSATSSRRSKSRARSGCSTASSVASSARLKAELEKVALLAKAAALKQRHALDEQELKVKAEKEQLELQSALAAADAQLRVLQKYEESHESSGAGVVTTVKEGESIIGPDEADRQSIHSPAAQVHNASGDDLFSHGHPTNGVAPSNSPVNTQTLCTVMQRQNEITECLVQQQRLSSLPPQNIPTFKGDPLDYILFTRAFEHGVESRTENSRDRLYFLEQYTTGQPRDLVQSCFHMKPDEGYCEAKRLLKEYFGNEYKISVAYMDKALNWPDIKADDSEALNSYALFLTSCKNAMAELEYMDEMDNAANMRAIISKCPYKLREKWRGVACDIQEKQQRKPRFSDIVVFVARQAKIALHPVFGDVKDRHKAQTKYLPNMRLEELWNQQFKYDFPEGRHHEQAEMSKEDLLFMDRVSTSAQLKGGHYCIGLPLKNKEVKMPNNRAIAEQRALNLKKQLLKNPQFQEDYITFMNDMISKSYAVKVPNKDINRSDGRVWYIPHHGVYHPKKHKIRVVFDCGASFQGTSLNEQLLQGPNLTNTLIGVLTRFRQEPLAVMADVEAMFHQVKVPADDADLLRFLWWPGGDVNQNLEEYRMEVHLFGATSSPSCASYALRRCAEDNKHIFDASVVNTVLHNFYIDDCLTSVASPEQALSLYHNLREICQTGGFRLTKWISNSTKVLSKIPDEEKAHGIKDLDLDHNPFPIERALGVQWCVQSDSFKFRVVIQNRPLTRRGILSMVSSVYDPLGILAPVILPAKNILQELSRSKVSWDDVVPDNLAQQWFKWVEGIQQLCEFGLDRCFKPACFGDPVSAHLHHFSDASEVGYGTVTYLVQQNGHNQIHCAFVLGKARVAPLKSTTIPRMELTAATLATRVDCMLRREIQLPLGDSVFWTDSTAVLKYIANETTRFRTFVANRVAAIIETSAVSQWKYICSQQNPADYASRGQDVDAFMQNKAWISGPDFLTKPVNKWPEMSVHLDEPTATDPEVKKTVQVNAIAVEESRDTLKQLIEHYSSWLHLKKATAWLLRIKNTLLKLSKRRKELSQCHSQAEMEKEMSSFRRKLAKKTLTVEELQRAEQDIVRYCQQKKFHEEILALKRNKHVRKGSHLCKLNPVLIDGILRVGGRLRRAAIPEEAKHPSILPKDHRVSELIVQEVHKEIGHGGRNHVLSHLRQKYWIPNATSLIRKVLSKCVTCRRLQGGTGQQQMADLPTNRVLPDEPPFTKTGVDYFGPFNVKRGRSTIKRYGVIFTCLTVRAVHIEMAASLDTDSFIQALRRFIARRGQVLEMRSDNGTNFVGAERELKKAIQEWNTSKIENTLLQRGIKWMFNPPFGSHHGGVWERMIRSIRKVLNTTLRMQNLDEEGLHTFLCEAEAILNSRPITTASNDPDDMEALTPNHLLLLKTRPSMPPGLFEREDLYARRRWRQVQYMADIFWKRWVKEYLPELQKRQKWTRVSRNYVPGDIVLIVDDSAPRNSWVLGRVTHTVQDEQGLVRRVRVKTNTRQGGPLPGPAEWQAWGRAPEPPLGDGGR
ncbi:hypothetical protein NFI96_008914, partial [Prochilodus magdalenae]